MGPTQLDLADGKYWSLLTSQRHQLVFFYVNMLMLGYRTKAMVQLAESQVGKERKLAESQCLNSEILCPSRQANLNGTSLPPCCPSTTFQHVPP